jgi:hypothetical protein
VLADHREGGDGDTTQIDGIAAENGPDGVADLTAVEGADLVEQRRRAVERYCSVMRETLTSFNR